MSSFPEWTDDHDTWLGRILHLLRVVRRPYTEKLGAASGSIFIRHVDGGSSNGAEVSLEALTTPVYDLGQYGRTFVASPRHADLLVVTGPFVRSMVGPARAAFSVMPSSRRIITIGEGFLGIDEGELFGSSYALAPLPLEMLEAHIRHVPGSPPSPQQILEALLET